MKTWILLAGLCLAACSDSTAPDVRCDGLVAVDIHSTRFGTDTMVACTFPPPDTVVVVDTVRTPPDTVTVPPDTVYIPRRCHWHGWRWTCHRGGHHD